jgi:hypothetical protein
MQNQREDPKHARYSFKLLGIQTRLDLAVRTQRRPASHWRNTTGPLVTAGHAGTVSRTPQTVVCRGQLTPSLLHLTLQVTVLRTVWIIG